MSTDAAQTFADAMQDLESTGDVAGFVADVFTADVELLRPETGQQENGADGARQFWQQYVDRFDDIHSEFSRVVGGEVGVLEWTSTGHLTGGADIDYSGVSLLDFDSEGKVTRFATYYDTSSFGPRP